MPSSHRIRVAALVAETYETLSRIKAICRSETVVATVDLRPKDAHETDIARDAASQEDQSHLSFPASHSGRHAGFQRGGSETDL